MPEAERDTFHWVPVEQVTTPPPSSHLLHFADMWWMTNGRGEVLLYRRPDGSDSAQANRDRSVMERFVERYSEKGVTGVLHIEHAFLPDDPGRY